MFGGTGGLTSSPVGLIASPPAAYRATSAAPGRHVVVVVEVLRRQLQALVCRGHRDADRQAVSRRRFRRSCRSTPTEGTPETLRPRCVAASPPSATGRSCPVPRRGRSSGRGVLGRPVRAGIGCPARRRPGLDPMLLPRKGIAGQRHALRLTPTQPCPVDVDSRRPELAERQQEGVAVISVLHLVPHQPNGAVTVRPLRMTHRRRGQGAAGTDLDEDPVRVAEQRRRVRRRT